MHIALDQFDCVTKITAGWTNVSQKERRLNSLNGELHLVYNEWQWLRPRISNSCYLETLLAKMHHCYQHPLIILSDSSIIITGLQSQQTMWWLIPFIYAPSECANVSVFTDQDVSKDVKMLCMYQNPLASVQASP